MLSSHKAEYICIRTMYLPYKSCKKHCRVVLIEKDMANEYLVGGHVGVKNVVSQSMHRSLSNTMEWLVDNMTLCINAHNPPGGYSVTARPSKSMARAHNRFEIKNDVEINVTSVLALPVSGRFKRGYSSETWNPIVFWNELELPYTAEKKRRARPDNVAGAAVITDASITDKCHRSV